MKYKFILLDKLIEEKVIHNIKKKLLLVADSKLAKFYLAEDFKIKSLIEEIKLEDTNIHHDRQSRRTGKINKSSGSGARFFDPHSEPKDLDRSDFCKVIMHEISKLFDGTNYDQLILVCGAKMLGDLRHEFPAKLKSVDTKEFKKEIIHDNVQQIEKEILEELKFK